MPNLALTATVTAASTLVTNDGRDWFASFAKDGIDFGHATGSSTPASWLTSGGVWHGNNGNIGTNPNWLLFDFGANKSVSSVRIVTVRDTGDTSPLTTSETFATYGLHSGKVQFSSDGVTFTDAATFTNDYRVIKDFASLGIASARYIRVLCAGSPDGFARVAEVGIEGTDVVGADTTPPSGSITSPAAAAKVRGAVSVNFSAADNVNLASAQLKVDGANHGSPVSISGTSAAGTLAFTTTSVADGNRSLTVLITDAAGNPYTTAAVVVEVDNTNPGGSITAPGAGETVSGTYNFTASASDATSGVKSVKFYIDGVLENTDSVAPFVFSKNTVSLANGGHSVFAVIEDNAGNIYQTPTVNFSVNNPLQVIGSTLRWDEIKRPEYYREFEPVWEDARAEHKYQDTGRSFNELTDSPERAWEMHYAPMARDTEAESYRVFNNAYRRTRYFSFVNKKGETFTNCLIKSFEIEYPLGANRSDVQRVKIIIVKYP